MLQQGVQRFPAGLRLGLLLPEEAHSAGLPTSPSERCSTAASKVFLRAKKLWVNPPKAERAKPSLSSDYNLLFKNKIGESSLDIHRYGYYILPTYPSDLAAITFDRSGTTHIGKFVICQAT